MPTPRKITIDPNHRGRPGTTSVRGDVLEIDLSPRKLLAGLADELPEAARRAIDTSVEQPERSTVERRGAGRMWSVTGRLRDGLNVKLTRDGLELRGPVDRLREPFIVARLLQTTALGDPARFLGQQRVRRALKRGVRGTLKVRRRAF